MASSALSLLRSSLKHDGMARTTRVLCRESILKPITPANTVALPLEKAVNEEILYWNHRGKLSSAPSYLVTREDSSGVPMNVRVIGMNLQLMTVPSFIPHASVIVTERENKNDQAPTKYDEQFDIPFFEEEDVSDRHNPYGSYPGYHTEPHLSRLNWGLALDNYFITDQDGYAPTGVWVERKKFTFPSFARVMNHNLGPKEAELHRLFI